MKNNEANETDEKQNEKTKPKPKRKGEVGKKDRGIRSKSTGVAVVM